MSGIFISYRREDSSGEAGRLYDRLSAHFGKDKVFMDVDGIDPGDDFVKTIDERVGSCDVLIAVIGPRWLSSKDEQGRRRLDDPQDFVRLEIVTALNRNIRVVPALVERAVTPRADELPEALAPLIRRNTLEISHTAFHQSVDRLIEVLNKTVGPAAEQRRNQQKLQAAVAQSGTKSNRGNGSRARATLAASIVIVGIVLVAGAGYWRLHTTVPPAANLSQASNDGPVSVPDDQSKSPRSGTDWATPIQQPKAAAPKTIPLGTPDKTQEKPADNAAVGQLSASEVAYRKGWKFYSDNQYDQALPFLQQAAAGNNINAIETIAYMYHNGQGLKQDHQQWLKLTIRAAELGSRASMGELAAAYQKGSFGIPTDSELSLHWYRKLADAGGGEAMYRLGEFYETGAMGLKQDLDQAISWYRKAAASDAKFAPDWARRALKRLGK